MQKTDKIKKILRKPWVMIIVTLVLIIGAIITGKNYISGNNQEKIDENTPIVKEVRTIKLDLNKQDSVLIDTVGSVRAEASVEIAATTQGTVRGIYFKVGDKVNNNRLLVSLYDSTILTNLNNANTNLVNVQSNLSTTKRMADESVRQAELGVQSAEETIEAARISLSTSQTNLENAKALHVKGNINTRNNAIISFDSYLNTISLTLDDVNYIIQAEDDGVQIPGIKDVLGVKNLLTVSQAKTDYWPTKNWFDILENRQPAQTTIEQDMHDMDKALSAAKQLTDSTIIVLENTVSSASFNDTALNGQITNITGLRATIMGMQTNTKNILYALENYYLAYNQDIDLLENGVKSAENQLQRYETNLENALISLENAKQNRNQQINNSEGAMNNAQGQVNLAQVQTGELTIKAPIKGVITKKYIEVGAEINPGQKIAEISKNDNLKIEVSLISEDIYRIEEGQIAYINNDLSGTITSIAPAADSITKKVKIEILFNNKGKKLIQGTFVNVSLPTKKLTKTHDQSIFIPLKAIIITQTENFVFINNNNKAKKINVVIGKTEGALVEIIDGLESGQELIIEGAKNIKNDENIAVVE
ncbi:efflux RND transporter periplasmic adaptor subunit [bacterium]|nr:efflux RND transporter periplasmic adaptor subunit [bacterium]